MRVAITGGIGEGKSTVLEMIRQLGRETVSSDDIARDVLSNVKTQKKVAEALGYRDYPSKDELRRRIAGDPGARRTLNRITHPRIVEAIRAHPAQFIEVPLLLEACLYGMVEGVWIVTCGREMQRSRLVERYGSAAKADELISTQLPTEAKLTFADAIIRTNHSMEAVFQDVAGLVADAVGG